MKKFNFILYCLLYVTGFKLSAQSCGVSAVYGGGPFYNNAAVTIPEIRSSGFNTAIVWTIHIDAKGNLNFNAEFPLVTDGAYVGTSKYPMFAGNMTLLKTPPSSVTRIEFGLSAAGSSTFANIKALVNSEGTGSTSKLYKNFKALKDSIPAVDAFNFDDESTYDIASSVKFAVMLNDLGFKVALCPYNNSNYWTSVASQTNTQRTGCVDKIFLQCYDGGASNNPCSWNFNGLPIYPGLWDTKDTPASVQTKMTNWKNQCSIKGGFMWLYDDFKGTAKTKQYASAINNALGIGVPGKASNDGPADAAVNVSTTPTLKWIADNCAVSHSIYFGNSNPPAFVGDQTAITYTPPTLNSNTTYYWRVDEKNFFGITPGTVWSFTTQKATANEEIIVQEETIHLSPAYPNPFSTEMSITVSASTQMQINIQVYNIIGKQLAILADKKMLLGETIFTWNGTDLSGNEVLPGIYFIRIDYADAAGTARAKSLKVVLQRNK